MDFAMITVTHTTHTLIVHLDLSFRVNVCLSLSKKWWTSRRTWISSPKKTSLKTKEYGGQRRCSVSSTDDHISCCSLVSSLKSSLESSTKSRSSSVMLLLSLVLSLLWTITFSVVLLSLIIQVQVHQSRFYFYFLSLYLLIIIPAQTS